MTSHEYDKDQLEVVIFYLVELVDAIADAEFDYPFLRCFRKKTIGDLDLMLTEMAELHTLLECEIEMEGT